VRRKWMKKYVGGQSERKKKDSELLIGEVVEALNTLIEH